MVESDVAVIAFALACSLAVLHRFTSDRCKRRFGAIGSPLIEPPVYRALFLLVIIGVLLISVLPEAASVLPAFDAVGLDVVTVFAALEIRHYLASMARVVGIPTGVVFHLRVPLQVVSRCAGVLRAHPVLLLYACMWPVIWLRTRIANK